MILKFFATLFWQYTPGYFQRLFSKLFSKFFFNKISRLIIVPYCVIFGLTNDYLDQFESDTGDAGYYSYSDFFKRKFKTPPNLEAQQVWPCEGYICDWGRFSEKNDSLVKGQKIDLNQIFHSPASVTKDYFFTNVFLHNHNYHRVHSPVSGEIKKITVIPGDLIFLRPWFYKRTDVSYPAFRNERLVFEIVDENSKSWFVALVGGFGVGTIEIHREFVNCGYVKAGQEIAKFDLGSTVCIASPKEVAVEKYMQKVSVGKRLFRS